MAMEVYSVDEVSSTRPDAEKPTIYEPFYSIRHAQSGGETETFWHSSRRPSGRRDDEGTEIYLTLVNLGFRPEVPDVETVTARVTCSNRDLPGRLPFGTGGGADFELEGAGVFTAIRCLRKPTSSLRPPLRRGTQWRLISHLSLNYLSLVESEGGDPIALQEILKLYDFADSSATRNQIRGPDGGFGQTGDEAGRFRRLRLRPRVGGVGRARRGPVHRKRRFSLRLRSRAVPRALQLHQLVLPARGVHSPEEGALKRWAPRAGEQIVL
jgi:hypothetical protein